MISGWFLCEKNFKISRVLKVQTKTWIYSIALMLIGIAFSLGSYTIGTYVEGILPVIMGEYWFITAWIGMALLSPFLNIIIKSLGHNRWKGMIIILTIMLSMIPQFIPKLTWYSDLIWLMYLYLLIGGVRKYDIKTPGLKTSLIVFISSFLLILLSAEVTLYLAKDYNILYRGLGYFSTRCVFIMLVCSLALFNVFRQLKFGNKRIINAFAKATFGVYLIHENAFINTWLWTKVFRVTLMYETNGLIFALWIIILALACFCVCAILDMIISKILDLLFYSKKFTAICERIENKIYLS